MPVYATVKTVLNQTTLFVSRRDGVEMTVSKPTPPNVQVGDVVAIDEQKSEFLHIANDLVYDRGNEIGIIETKVGDDYLVNINGNIIRVGNPDNLDINEGYTVELSDVDTIRNVLSDEPISGLSSLTEHTNVENVVSSLRQASDEIDVGYEDFGGLTGQIKHVQKRFEVILNNRDEIKAIGSDVSLGALFYGPPGTGKTHFARILAGESEATFYRVRGPEIVVTWIGDTERIIRGLFKDASENEPSIIFFDEIDSLGNERGDDTNQQFGNRIVAQLLSVMDGFDKEDSSILVIASTNRKEGIDEALLRPGRFDWEIPFPLPSKSERADIFDTIKKGYKISGNIDSEQIAEITDGWTGADLKSLLDESGLICVEKGRKEITLVDIMKAIERISIQEGR